MGAEHADGACRGAVSKSIHHRRVVSYTISRYSRVEETCHGQDQHRARRPPDPGGSPAVRMSLEARARSPGPHRAAEERATARLAVAPGPGEVGRRPRRTATPSTVIVVDTTVWIDFLEARGTAFDRHLTELVETDASIALVDIVYCEVLQGIRDDDVYRRT